MLMGALIGAAVGAVVFLITKQMKAKKDGGTLDADVVGNNSEEGEK